MFNLVIDALLDCHGEPLLYKGSGSLSIAFTGVFDEVFTMIDPDSGERVTTNVPSIVLKLSDLPELPVRLSQFDGRNKHWQVDRVEPDGQGAARIFLEEIDA